jgi:dihydrofolate reductase
MRKLVVTQFVSLDGVMENPRWTFEFDRGDEGEKFKLDEVMDADALLLGRVTYEGFAEAWPDREDEEGFADQMNEMAKYVVSTTLKAAEWNNSTVIGENVVEEIAKLKQQDGKDILVAGSNTLVDTLMENDLVDEYRLMVFPVVLGEGKRLFEGAATKRVLKLAETQAVGPDGVIVLTYHPAG